MPWSVLRCHAVMQESPLAVRGRVGFAEASAMPIEWRMRIVTLAERKATEAARRARAVDGMRGALSAYARAHGGWFLLYGSAARGGRRYHSDVDVLLDFPQAKQAAAWRFVEAVCGEQGLEADIMPVSWCHARFMDHIRPDIVVLG